MKITLLALVLLLAFSTRPLLGAVGAVLEEVVDTSGEKLRVGAYYYIVQAPLPKNGSGLGLGLAGLRSGCPVDIVAVEGYGGDSLSFRPINSKKLLGVVRVSTDLNIVLSGEVDCPHSNVWKLDDYDASTGQWFVTTGGDVGNPGPQTVRSWFKIEKYEDYYKLVYCPSVCKYCKVLCKDIGLYEDRNGNKRLALSDVPYKIQFQRD